MASKCINKSTLVGFVGQPPEVRYLPSGGAVTTVRVATSDSWRDKETGETKEHTEWHSVVVFGKLAEFLGEHLQKGAQVYVEGSLRTRNWTDQSGQVKYSTEIIVNNGGSFIILGKRNDSASAPASQPQQSPAPQTDYPDVPDNIPF